MGTIFIWTTIVFYFHAQVWAGRMFCYCFGSKGRTRVLHMLNTLLLSCIFSFFPFILFFEDLKNILIFNCFLWVCGLAIHTEVEGRREFVEVSSLLFCRSWGLNSSCQACWQSPLPAEPGRRPERLPASTGVSRALQIPGNQRGRRVGFQAGAKYIYLNKVLAATKRNKCRH